MAIVIPAAATMPKPGPKPASTDLAAVLKSNAYEELTKVGGRIGAATTKSVTTTLIRVTQVTTEVEFIDPATGEDETSSQRWSFQEVLDDSGTIVVNRTVLTTPLPRGRSRDFYKGRARFVKAARVLLDLLLNTGPELTTQVSDDRIRASAARIGVRYPSDQTCTLVRNLLRACFLTGRRSTSTKQSSKTSPTP